MISRAILKGGVKLPGAQWTMANPKMAPLLKIPVRHIYPHTSSNVVSGAPMNRIPFPEKVATGLFIFGCIAATPAWILTHMDCYRTLPSDVHMQGSLSDHIQ